MGVVQSWLYAVCLLYADTALSLWVRPPYPRGVIFQWERCTPVQPSVAHLLPSPPLRTDPRVLIGREKQSRVGLHHRTLLLPYINKL